MTLQVQTITIFRKALLLGMLAILGCVDPYPVESLDFEDRLVVQATLTDEDKQHQIFLSRTIALDQQGSRPESGAQVQVRAGAAIYSFYETHPGVYQSHESFAALPDTEYQLMISAGGKTYLSDQETLPTPSPIEDVNAELITDEDGNESAGIFVNSYNPGGTSRNYRYEYEETYKIVAPSWRDKVLVPASDNSCAVNLEDNNPSGRVCYITNASNDIIQYSTSNLSEDRVDHYMIRDIAQNNYIISHRYSILVRQYVQSNEAYAYYEALNTFSGQESVFTGAQPGFFQGNMSSTDDPDEQVIGFFEVAAVSEKRLFFNYADIFSEGQPIASYADSCTPYDPPISYEGSCVLRELIEANIVRYYANNDNPPPPGPDEPPAGPYLVVPRICGDCTVIGEVEVPEFWTE